MLIFTMSYLFISQCVFVFAPLRRNGPYYCHCARLFTNSSAACVPASIRKLNENCSGMETITVRSLRFSMVWSNRLHLCIHSAPYCKCTPVVQCKQTWTWIIRLQSIFILISVYNHIIQLWGERIRSVFHRAKTRFSTFVFFFRYLMAAQTTFSKTFLTPSLVAEEHLL